MAREVPAIGETGRARGPQAVASGRGYPIIATMTRSSGKVTIEVAVDSVGAVTDAHIVGVEGSEKCSETRTGNYSRANGSSLPINALAVRGTLESPLCLP